MLYLNDNAIIRENVIILDDSSIGSNTICENNVSIGKRCLIQNNTMIGSDSIIEEKIDSELIGGVVIRLGDTVIDGSMKNKVKQLRRELV